MKKSNAKFIQHSLGLYHKLADEKASGTARTLVDALTETWFNTGRHNRHLNPFPLELCDTGKWGLTRMQKSRATEISGPGEAYCCEPARSERALGDPGLGGPLSIRSVTWRRWCVTPMKRCVTPMLQCVTHMLRCVTPMKRFPS
jgi:hypothetical protein